MDVKLRLSLSPKLHQEMSEDGITKLQQVIIGRLKITCLFSHDIATIEVTDHGYVGESLQVLLSFDNKTSVNVHVAQYYAEKVADAIRAIQEGRGGQSLALLAQHSFTVKVEMLVQVEQSLPALR